jgi:hypothetical protein
MTGASAGRPPSTRARVGLARVRLLALLAALAAAPAAARADEPTPIALKAGEKLALCAGKLAHCPVSSFMCDDPRVAIIENGPAGAELKGISAGVTLCSVLGYETAFRRVFRVTVR